MTYILFREHQLPFEEMTHGTPRESTAAARAIAANLPLAYLAHTTIVEVEDRRVAVVYPADRTLRLTAVAEAVSGQRATCADAETTRQLTGVEPEVLSPWQLPDEMPCLWDLRCLTRASVLLPTEQATRSLRLDTRHLLSAGVSWAAVSEPVAPGPADDAFDILVERGFVDRVTSEEMARKHLGNRSASVYIGFDPTADSLHVGSLVPIMALAHLQRQGVRTIALVGGATGAVGDPSGKTEMRKMLGHRSLEDNLTGIERQLSVYLSLDGERGVLVNNASWFAELPFLEVLRELGPHFLLNDMLHAESIRRRLEQGLTYLEFSYQLLQAYDFVRLAEDQGCFVQMGGSDQWGNIVAGKALGRRATGGELFGGPIRRSADLVGVTFPLLTKADGGKFGKTESGTIWLDAARTSVYDFFQFWRNTADQDTRRFLATFTFIEPDDIERLCAAGSGEQMNLAKEVLAVAATALAHGEHQAMEAARSSRELFGGYGEPLKQELERLGLLLGEAADLFAKASSTGTSSLVISRQELDEPGTLVIDALLSLGLVSSKGEARRLVKQGGVYVDGARLEDPRALLVAPTDGAEITLRVGKKKYGIVEIGD